MLVQEVREYWFKSKAKKKALEKLKALGLENIAVSHHSTLGGHNSLYVQLIRASMIEGKTMIIDTPFAFVPNESNVAFLFNVLKRLNIEPEKVKIFDLITMENRYKESPCNIEKW